MTSFIRKFEVMLARP